MAPLSNRRSPIRAVSADEQAASMPGSKTVSDERTARTIPLNTARELIERRDRASAGLAEPVRQERLELLETADAYQGHRDAVELADVPQRQLRQAAAPVSRGLAVLAQLLRLGGGLLVGSAVWPDLRERQILDEQAVGQRFPDDHTDATRPRGGERRQRGALEQVDRHLDGRQASMAERGECRLGRVAR